MKAGMKIIREYFDQRLYFGSFSCSTNWRNTLFSVIKPGKSVEYRVRGLVIQPLKIEKPFCTYGKSFNKGYKNARSRALPSEGIFFPKQQLNILPTGYLPKRPCHDSGSKDPCPGERRSDAPAEKRTASEALTESKRGRKRKSTGTTSGIRESTKFFQTAPRRLNFLSCGGGSV